MSQLRDLYGEVILDHNKKPRNFKVLDPCDCKAHGYNPLCGDDYEIFANLNNETVSEVAFQGEGCAISKASASMMTSRVSGRPISEVETMIAQFRQMMAGELPEDHVLGHLKVFAGVAGHPARIKCAVLPWHALQAALDGREVASTEGEHDQWAHGEEEV